MTTVWPTFADLKDGTTIYKTVRMPTNATKEEAEAEASRITGHPMTVCGNPMATPAPVGGTTGQEE